MKLGEDLLLKCSSSPRNNLFFNHNLWAHAPEAAFQIFCINFILEINHLPVQISSGMINQVSVRDISQMKLHIEQ